MMRKFGMKGLMNRVKGALVQQAFLDEHPLRVFAIAYRYSLEDEGRIAAKYTIREPFFAPYVKEVEHMATSFYQKSMRGPSTSWSAPRTFFGERPCAKAVADLFLIAECLEKASGCCTCRPLSAFLDDSAFIGEHFAVKVEREYYSKSGSLCAYPSVSRRVELDIPCLAKNL
ncbi:hypothetical protein K503DRAFT_21794 [Rhizopogon vinicolor AM-OR11-026]|uniref:Uncharacterized protein n=1 Tax=Rhizopogon vinicolor AM-OR11-026 TaxID=1314800 RepID=A0A1B7N5N6_9AGAM|nr:hypothetical protein K503DRAFT_21794 [Rhizopogon vinicolor AM-OR11-026]